MNKNMILAGSIMSIVILSGCKTSSVQLPPEQASEQFYDCLYTQYNQAISKGTPAGDPSIDAAIEACDDAVMVYANTFAKKYHMRADKHYEHAYGTYRPILQKEAKNQLRAYLKKMN